MIEEEATPGIAGTQQLAAALLASVKEAGRVSRQLARVGQLTETVRDRLTDDMYATFTHMLREAQSACAQATSLDRLGHAMNAVMRFAAAVAGVAAENMVRGGGWLFLDLGRRIERAHLRLNSRSRASRAACASPWNSATAQSPTAAAI
jgi:uncharacterized alpha-E superfamily protein